MIDRDDSTRRPDWVWLGGMLCGCAITLGCGEAEPRRPLHGTVRVDGQNVDRGSIHLFPAGEVPAPSTATSIARGRYRFETDNGPFPGKYRVLISVEAIGSASPAGEEGAAVSAAKMPPSRRRRKSSDGSERHVPRNWESEIEVVETGEDNRDFEFSTSSP